MHFFPHTQEAEPALSLGITILYVLLYTLTQPIPPAPGFRIRSPGPPEFLEDVPNVLGQKLKV